MQAQGGRNDSNLRTNRIDWNGLDGRLVQSLRASTVLGSSIKGTNLSSIMSNVKYGIVCGIEVTNWTKFELTDPAFSAKSGFVSSPPVSIQPNTIEIVITHKHGYTMTGSGGIVSWLVKGKSRRIFVMWESPYFTSNSLAVGITKIGVQTHNEAWFNQIEKNPKSSHQEFNFTHARFKSTCSQTMVDDDEFEILGMMGSSGKPEVRITFRPKRMMDLSTIAEIPLATQQ